MPKEPSRGGSYGTFWVPSREGRRRGKATQGNLLTGGPPTGRDPYEGLTGRPLTDRNWSALTPHGGVLTGPSGSLDREGREEVKQEGRFLREGPDLTAGSHESLHSEGRRRGLQKAGQEPGSLYRRQKTTKTLTRGWALTGRAELLRR